MQQGEKGEWVLPRWGQVVGAGRGHQVRIVRTIMERCEGLSVGGPQQYGWHASLQDRKQ